MIFFNSASDANKHLEASEQEEMEDIFESWLLDKLDDFEFAAKFLIKHLSEKHHPHICCIVDSTSAKIFEGKKVFKTNDYIVD